MPLAGPVETNLGFCRNYWESGATLVGCVFGPARGHAATTSNSLPGYEADTEDNVLRGRWTQSLGGIIWVSPWIHLQSGKAWCDEPG